MKVEGVGFQGFKNPELRECRYYTGSLLKGRPQGKRKATSSVRRSRSYAPQRGPGKGEVWGVIGLKPKP